MTDASAPGWLLDYAKQLGRMQGTLQVIARGRPDNGRPLAAETARQLARSALIECGVDWPDAKRTRP